MINHSRDNLPHIRSRQQREWIDEAVARSERPSNSDTISNRVESEILKIIDRDHIFNKNRLGIQYFIGIKNKLWFSVDNILPIINSLNNNIVRVKKGLWFKVDGRYYEVVETPLFDDWMVEARELFPKNPNNFPQSHYFDPRQVLSSAVDIHEVISVFIERFGLPNKWSIDTSWFKQWEYIDTSLFIKPVDEIIKYPFLDESGQSHFDMEAVRRANLRILKDRFLKKNNLSDLLIKILPNQNFKE